MLLRVGIIDEFFDISSIFECVTNSEPHFEQKLLSDVSSFPHEEQKTIMLDHRLCYFFFFGLFLLERTFQKERRYEYRHGLKTKDVLKSVQEITVAKISVQNIADYCIEKRNAFQI